MIKKLICFLWGHKNVMKAYTGENMRATSVIGMEHDILTYVWQRFNYCLRCGKTLDKQDIKEKKEKGLFIPERRLMGHYGQYDLVKFDNGKWYCLKMDPDGKFRTYRDSNAKYKHNPVNTTQEFWEISKNWLIDKIIIIINTEIV